MNVIREGSVLVKRGHGPSAEGCPVADGARVFTGWFQSSIRSRLADQSAVRNSGAQSKWAAMEPDGDLHTPSKLIVTGRLIPDA
jgi:hypothetical protein